MTNPTTKMTLLSLKSNKIWHSKINQMKNKNLNHISISQSNSNYRIYQMIIYLNNKIIMKLSFLVVRP
jgi:hypothetical protein